MTVRTKDEKFILCLYDAAMRVVEAQEGEGGERVDPEEVGLDRYVVGATAGLQPKGVDAITQQLIRANFIRKEDELLVRLTPHGLSLARRLLEE